MAETAVSFAIRTLGSFLVEEITLLGSVKQEVKSIKRELESIKSFLKDADARAAAEEQGDRNEGVLTWVKQVREAAYHIEDVIDTFSYAAAQLPHGRGILDVFGELSRLIKKLKLRRDVASDIQGIKTSLDQIQQSRQRYDFRSVDPGSSSGRSVMAHDSRIGSFFIEDTEIVEVESTRDELINLLVHGKSNISVIVLVGEGGLGKTTLACKIYENEIVEKHFDCQVTVIVGKECNGINLLRSIIREFSKLKGLMPMETERMEEKELISTLRDRLKEKCYMILFDDVWKSDFWEVVKPALPDNEKGSRIMITTRYKRVAESVPSRICNIHMLEPLPFDKAWQLFCTKAFGHEMSCPQELLPLSQQILQKCGGLPLAIVAVGGILSNKKQVVSEWKKLLDGLGSKLGSDPYLKSCNRVLSESYHELPPHLKPCLLYFGLFPEYSESDTDGLIDRWIAEGFVPHNGGFPPEEVAEEYLTELIDRSLVLVVDRDFTGRATRCKVQALMREIIVKKTEELGFCRTLDDKDSSHCNGTRRISIYRTTNNVLENIRDSKIRSLCLSDIGSLPESFMTTIVANFKLIKVLAIKDVGLNRLPDEVGNLFFLHYLGLRSTKVKELPKSIGMLINLDTMDLHRSPLIDLPVEIKNLKKLRRLHAGKYDKAKIHKGFGALKALHMLKYVTADSQVLKELRKLTELRVLGVNLPIEDVKDFFTIVGNMEKIKHLAVRSTSAEDEILDTESMACPPQSLEWFHLKANIKKLPVWMFELQNLVSIKLTSTGRSSEIPISVLQALPKLLRLHLKWIYCGEQLHFKEGWFPKLQNLFLENFQQLKSMRIKKGAMPNLRELKIGPCLQLKEMSGIEHLGNLKKLTFQEMLKEAYSLIKDKNWEQVTKHIPAIYVTDSRSYFYTDKYFKFQTPEQLISLSTHTERSDNQGHLRNDTGQVCRVVAIITVMVVVLINLSALFF